MADTTVRYRALSRVSYAHAFLAVIDYAREHPEPDFAFGPLDLSAVEQSGLLLSGPDLQGVVEVLAKVPGLIEVPA